MLTHFTRFTLSTLLARSLFYTLLYIISRSICQLKIHWIQWN